MTPHHPHPLPWRRRLRDHHQRGHAHPVRPVPRPEPGRADQVGRFRQGRSRHRQPRGFRSSRRHRQDRRQIRLPCRLRRRGQGLADGSRHSCRADPRHHLGHPRQGRRHRDPAARMPSLVADQAEGRQLHFRRADGLHRLCRRLCASTTTATPRSLPTSSCRPSSTSRMSAASASPTRRRSCISIPCRAR